MWWRRARYVLSLLALCALATCPVAKRNCTAAQRAREADELLGFLADRVAQAVKDTGRVPPLPAGPTPTPSCCEQGGTCPPDPVTWAAPGWRQFGFSIDDPFRFSYQYLPDAGGGGATLRALGDLACDGHALTVEVKLTVEGGAVRRVWQRTTAEQ
jgi:hypothetical protein